MRSRLVSPLLVLALTVGLPLGASAQRSNPYKAEECARILETFPQEGEQPESMAEAQAVATALFNPLNAYVLTGQAEQLRMEQAHAAWRSLASGNEATAFGLQAIGDTLAALEAAYNSPALEGMNFTLRHSLLADVEAARAALENGALSGNLAGYAEVFTHGALANALFHMANFSDLDYFDVTLRAQMNDPHVRAVMGFMDPATNSLNNMCEALVAGEPLNRLDDYNARIGTQQGAVQFAYFTEADSSLYAYAVEALRQTALLDSVGGSYLGWNR